MLGPAGFNPATHIGNLLVKVSRQVIEAGDPSVGLIARGQTGPHGGVGGGSKKAPIASKRDAGGIQRICVDFSLQQMTQNSGFGTGVLRVEGV